jgi:hypothetical protein
LRISGIGRDPSLAGVIQRQRARPGRERESRPKTASNLELSDTGGIDPQATEPIPKADPNLYYKLALVVGAGFAVFFDRGR